MSDNEVFRKRWIVIAGPCAAESRDQILTTARGIKAAGGDVLRAGLWKPRTSPDAWQGCGDEGLSWMVEAKNETGLAITTEVKDLRTIEATLRAGFDALWVGSRNGQNFSLLDEVGMQTNNSDTPVVVKRTMSSSLEEWIGAAEYVARHNPNVILCERGIRGYSPDTRNILDLQTAVLAREKTGLPVIVDPSHAAGRRDLITSMSLATKASGLNGIMVEVHPNPDQAKTDSKQQITIDHFGEVIRRLQRIPDDLYE